MCVEYFALPRYNLESLKQLKFVISFSSQLQFCPFQWVKNELVSVFYNLQTL